MDAVKRAARTFLQGFVAVLLGSGILSAMSEGEVVDWSALKKVGISAAAAGLMAVLAYLQNALEDRNIIPQVIPKD